MAKNYSNGNSEKEVHLLERRLIDLSRVAYQRDIITFTDFLNLNEQNILHTLPKDSLYTGYILFGGYASAERQMAAFIPEALSLRYGKKNLLPEELGYPFQAVEICPRNIRFAEDLTHRDFLGAILNLGIERSRTGDILLEEHRAYLFAQTEIAELVSRELSNVRHTPVKCRLTELEGVEYVPRTEAVRGTVSSVRLDSLLPLAFLSSRSRLSGLIEGAKVFVNGKLITSNGYQVKETDLISVRGMGKFRYIGTGGKTKKKRLSVEIERYI